MRLLFFSLYDDTFLTSNSYESCRASPAYRENSACGIQLSTATAAIFGADHVGQRVIAASLALEALNDLKKYLKAASVLIVQASTGLDRSKFDTFSPEQRNSVATQLQTLADQLSKIFLEQTTLVNQLEFVVGLAKDPSKTATERKTYWDNNVLPRIRTVYETVTQVKNFSDKPDQPFSIALSPEERVALGDTLTARGVALRTFERMAPPASSDEVLQFEGLIADYKVLIQNLFKLRVAITEAQRRLSSA